MGNSRQISKWISRIYHEHADAIFRYCYFKTSSREMGEELTQETFLRVLTYVTAGKKIQHPKTFLYQVAKNLVIDWYKTRGRTLSLEAALERGAIAETPAPRPNEQAREEALGYINRLPDEDKDIFILRYVEDLSVKEIAKIMNTSENVISVRIHRGLAKIKHSLTAV